MVRWLVCRVYVLGFAARQSKKRMNVMRVLDDVAAWVETNCSFFSAVHPLVSNEHLPPPAPTGEFWQQFFGACADPVIHLACCLSR